MESAKPSKYTPFKGAKAARYVQNSFKGASKPKERFVGFKKGGGTGDPTLRGAKGRKNG